MRKRLLYVVGTLLLFILVALLVWQTSFSFGDFGPTGPEQTLVLWGVSTLIFILTVTLGFMLARNFIKLWVERHRNREGSRIRTKLVFGALVLTITPVVFLVLFSYVVLNRNLDKWFSRPAEEIKLNLIQVANAIHREELEQAESQADYISTLPDAAAARAGTGTMDSLQQFCIDKGIESVVVRPPDHPPLRLCYQPAEGRQSVEVKRGDITLTSFPRLTWNRRSVTSRNP